jgi:hypothetical protein
MKESNWKGLAIHSGPESWVFVGNDEGQALTGERAGRVFNREMYAPWLAARDFRGADALREPRKATLRMPPSQGTRRPRAV